MTDSHDGDDRDGDPSPSGSRSDEAPEAVSSAGADEESPAETTIEETDGGRTAEAERSSEVSGAEVPAPSEDPLEWFRRTDNELVIVFKDVASSVGIVIVIGLLLFTISGVWPPLVAIESGSMNPHMHKGDLVFIMDNDRLTPDAATAGTGVVTYQEGKETGYETFGSYGDVIVFERSSSETPIIHRARFYVEEGENWYDKADKDHIRADNCAELRQCPAPHAGFVTKGDNPQTNQYYDQARYEEIVRPEQIQGTAEFRIPWLGCIRLEFSGTASCRPVLG